MLYLRFSVGEQPFALACAPVVRIIPWVPLQPLAASPEAVVGLLSHQQQAIPILDLGQLVGGQASVPGLSTRIMLVHYPFPQGSNRLLGLLAEEVLEVSDLNDVEVRPCTVRRAGAPFLDRIALRGREIVQLITLETLLSGDMRDVLFPEATSTSS